jgi:hypothetical protein
MHAHTFSTQKRTPAPSQILRGEAGSCAAVERNTAKSLVLCGSLCPAPRRSEDARYPWPGAAARGLDSIVDWGNLVEGGPV